MRVTLINTTDSGGGAPVACRRLMNALDASNQVDVSMLVQQQKLADRRIQSHIKTFFDKLIAKGNFLAERLPFIGFHAKDKSVRFAFSTATVGADISADPVVKNADILHLHWINSGFLSVDNLKQLVLLNKPVVWTLHDMWAFTGGCHYAGSCTHFEQECGHCPFLRDAGEHDLSRKGWFNKQELYQLSNKIVFVACSNWLADVARQSSLLNGFKVIAIPNPIDTSVFHPKNKEEIRKKWKISHDVKIVMFGAANVTDRRKGITYLVEALKRYKSENHPAIEIVMVGKNKSFDTSQIPFPVHELEMISSENEMIDLYNLADVFVLPSIEDNLPNMVMEAMACSTPVVAFNTGGLGDLIDHQVNGYLADYKSSEDLAFGINWVLSCDADLNLSEQARKKVIDSFSPDKIAAQYVDVYQSLAHEQ